MGITNKITAAYREYLEQKVCDKVVLYEAFDGLGVLDNPRALFLELLNRKECGDITHVWSIEDFDMSRDNIDEFKQYNNVIFVKRNSKEYVRYLATARYLINNETFPEYFSRRMSQTYVNTGDGIPTKHMGYDYEKKKVEDSAEVVRNLLMADYVLASNETICENIYDKAFMLSGLFEGRTIIEGQPRTDLLINAKKEDVIAKLKNIGIDINKKVVLYAPTWKGLLQDDLQYDISELKNAISEIKKGIGNEYDVFLRVHYYIYKELVKDQELRNIMIPYTIDTNELLSVVDVLVTDYSSIFFDFLKTGRPVIFYMPDLEEYENNRGLYIPIDKLPGPISKQIYEVSNLILNINEIMPRYCERYEETKNWAVPYDNGKVSKRVLDIILTDYFMNYEENDYKVEDYYNKIEKKRLLLIADFSKEESWQDKFIDAVDEIDFGTYDVTIITPHINDKKQIGLLQQVNSKVRILSVSDKYVLNKKELSIIKKFSEGKFTESTKYNIVNVNLRKSLLIEKKRILGYTYFDKIVYTGELSSYWEALLKIKTSAEIKKYTTHEGI